MTINTKQVTGRRELHFESLDDVLADAERLAAGEARMLGNWSLGQILSHLAVAMNSAIDGVDFKVPFFIRLIAPLMKKRFVRGPIKPGFQMPESMRPIFMPPDEVNTEDGLLALREAVARLKSDPTRDRNVFLGNLTREESDSMQMRHAELHLSFATSIEA